MIKQILKKVAFLNAFTGIILQICNLISTFILPQIILSFFGSEVNGLVSSIGNFLLYVSLFEASVSNIVMTSLYKPLRNNDSKGISQIFNTSDYFYRKITILFTVYTIILSIIYPILFKTSFPFWYVCLLVLILAISYFIQYCFSNSLRTLLKADKKVYIVNLTQALIIILNLILSVISVYIYPEIHLLKFISGILFILQPIIFKHYVNKKFIIDKKCGTDTNLMKNRWDGFAISIASFVHNMTDIALLTYFCDLKNVSIYSVYYIVIRGLEAIMTSISNGIIPSLGNLYASDNENIIQKKFATYELFYTILVFVVFTIAGMLITPFVSLYTNNISDANYYQPLFGYLIIIGEALFLIKTPHVNMAYAANGYKAMKKAAYIEALINITISLILVKKFGLIGVAVGTTLAMLYGTIFQINLTRKILKLKTKYKKYIKLFLFLLVSTIGITMCKLFVKITIVSWLSWIGCAIVYTLIISLLFMITILLFYEKEIKELTNYFKK